MLQCDGGTATNALFEELYNQSTTKMMIIGAGCSIATEPTAHASHHWNLIQVYMAFFETTASVPDSAQRTESEADFQNPKPRIRKGF